MSPSLTSPTPANAVDPRYAERRGQIEHYFDRTAAQAWARLTSDAPVSGIRATVRAGREAMRSTITSWLGTELTPQAGTAVRLQTPLEQDEPAVAPAYGQRLLGRSLLDAGCGTGLLSFDAARLGADVVAIDLSPTLVALASQRLPSDLGPGSVVFRSGDMLDPALGRFDHLVAMDSLIHYAPEQAVSALSALAPRIRRSMVFTFAPSSPLLQAMMMVGKWFPRADRSPAIVPVRFERLCRLLRASDALAGWQLGRRQRVSRGFYTSEALELLAPVSQAERAPAEVPPIDCEAAESGAKR
ncbi:MAG: magnesium protoporphyrin IX methyltransferase [Burkholderiaceae bacterium]